MLQLATMAVLVRMVWHPAHSACGLCRKQVSPQFMGLHQQMRRSPPA